MTQQSSKLHEREHDATQPLPTVGEQLCLALYAYRFGTIGFLELLAQFEETLALPSPQTDRRTLPEHE